MERRKSGDHRAGAVRRLRWSLFSRYAMLLLATLVLGGLLTPCFADEGPRPIPRARRPETRPNHRCRGQSVCCSRADRPSRAGLRPEKEGLRRVPGPAGQRTAGRQSWPTLLAMSGSPHNFSLDPAYRISGALHAGRVRPADLRPGAQEKRRVI